MIRPMPTEQPPLPEISQTDWDATPPANHVLRGTSNRNPLPHDLAFLPDTRPLFIDLDLRTRRGRQDRRPDGAHGLFFAATV
jgi:hypothetical protein